MRGANIHMTEAVDLTVHYTDELEDRIAAWARAKIEPKRIGHVRGVVNMVEHLALLYAPDDVRRARLAGWIHDVAKHWSDDELLDFARSHRLPISDTERTVPSLLHGAVGYALANDIFLLDDAALRAACANHTTGAPNMDTLDKIVFLGDLIEPGRSFPGIMPIREEAQVDLDTAVLRAVDFTIAHLIDRHKIIEPRAILLHNQLLASGSYYSD